MYAVAARRRANDHQDGAGVRCGGAHQASGGEQSDAHGVDERVAVVAGREDHLAAHVRHADAVAVARDSGDDALEQIAVARVVQGPEPQGVQEGNGPRAHGENVAHDAADPRRRALVGLDGGRVVVRLDLEDNRQTIADVHDARVLLARLHQDGGSGGGEALEQRLRVLVAAMLAPERAEQSELQLVGLAFELLHDEVVLLTAEGDLVEGFLGYGHQLAAPMRPKDGVGRRICTRYPSPNGEGRVGSHCENDSL